VFAIILTSQSSVGHTLTHPLDDLSVDMKVCTQGFQARLVVLTHIQYLSEPTAQGRSVDDEIQMQGGGAALIMSEILTCARERHASLLGAEDIRHFCARLDQWQLELPSFMKIDVLLAAQDSKLSIGRTWAVLLVNVLHLGASLLLYRQLIVEDSKQAQRWKLDMSLADLNKYEVQCELAAHQMLRVVSAIHAEGPFLRKCWLIK
jgi:hypothetical protein